ncbi:MAG: hypothetical protein H6Q54_1153, partial [Deltaproteobacteria bacterium]|nr:hypothetical protein [Deltaproteobacteria bacterium]
DADSAHSGHTDPDHLEQTQKSKDSFKKTKPLTAPDLSPEAEEIYRYWKDKGLHAFKEGTKTYIKDCRKLNDLIEGKASANTEFSKHKKLMVIDILKAIDRYADSYEKDSKAITIEKLIYNPFSNGSKMGRSRLLYYVENIPEKKLLDKNPSLTKAIRMAYVNAILGGTEVTFSTKNNNHFISAAEKVSKFIEKKIEVKSFLVLRQMPISLTT